MMEFMDSLKRGVDRAGFEVDRLLRANRVRSNINALRSQMDEEVRQIGHQVIELYQRGESVQEQLHERCERVKRYREEIAERDAELEAINREMPAPVQPEPAGFPRPEVVCPSCGAQAPGDASFCPHCGIKLKAALQTPPPPPPTE